MSTIRLYLGGNEGDIPAAALGESITALDKMLKSVGANNVTIQNLEMGSASAVLESEDIAVGSIGDGLLALANGDPVPPSWRDDTLKLVSDLYSFSQYRGVSMLRVDVKGAQIHVSGKVSSAAESILNEKNEEQSEYLSGVTGRLYRINIKNQRSAGAGIETSSGESVSISVPEGLVDAVAPLTNKNVNVWGLVTPRGDGSRSIAVEGIEEIPDYQHVTTDEVLGIIPKEDLNGLDPVEWVREYRVS